MIRHIEIDACLNGFIVRCGCQTLVYTSVQQATEEIAAYLANPDETEKRILANGINRKHTYDNVVPAPAYPQDTCAGPEPCCETATGVARF